MKGINWTRLFLWFGVVVVVDVLMAGFGVPPWLKLVASVLMGLAIGIDTERHQSDTA